MSGQESSGEKAHEATPRRLEKAREQGESPRSQDAQSFAAYLGLTLVVLIGGGWATRHLGTTLTPFLDRPAEIAPLLMAPGAKPAAGEVLARLALPVFAILAAPAALILALLGAQRGIVFVPSRILPKLSRLSPVENARNKYGPRGLVEFAKSTVKLTALVTLLALVVWGERTRLAQFVWVEAHQIGLLLDRQFRLIITGVLVVAAAIAFFDLIWQRADHLRRMRMTHQDMKDEEKQAEGDPFLRAQRRERGRQIATNRMLLAVPDADVVITNPSHYAVALKWNRDQGSAPVCLAKGADEIALAIRARAAEMRLGVERAEAARQHARIAELKGAIAAPLENMQDPARGGLAAEAAWRAHLDSLLRRETQAQAETAVRLDALRHDLAHAFGREHAASQLAADARAEALRLAARRAEGQTIPARVRGQSRSSPSGSSADSGAGSPGMA